MRIGRDGDDHPQRRVIYGECHPRCRPSRFPLLVQHDRTAGVRHVTNAGVIGRLCAMTGQTCDSQDAVFGDGVDRDGGGGHGVAHGVDGHVGDRLDRGGSDQRPCEVAHAAEPPVVYDLSRRLGGHHQQPCDEVGVVVNRAVRVREKRLFVVAVAVDQQPMIDVPHRFARVHTGEQRSDVVPDLGPRLPGAAPQRVRMLGRSQDWTECVVVKLRVLGAPDDHHWELGAQHHLDEEA